MIIDHSSDARQFDPPAVINRLLAAADNYDVAACDAELAAAAAALPALSLVRDVVGPLLRETGNRWRRTEFSIVQEHMLSGVIRRQLAYALDRLSVGTAGPRILFTTLGGERHEIGSLMMAVVAASQGCRCVYLGPDLPMAEVARFCRHQPIELVVLSLVTQPEVNDAATQLRQLRAALPDPVEVWIGGQAAALLPAADLPPDVMRADGLQGFLESLAALQQLQEQP